MRPLLVTSRTRFAKALAQARRDAGLTCEALDYLAGFSDRYVAKLEHPDTISGRGAFRLSGMGEIWLEALGMRLVLMTVEQAKALGATSEPESEGEPAEVLDAPMGPELGPIADWATLAA